MLHLCSSTNGWYGRISVRWLQVADVVVCIYKSAADDTGFSLAIVSLLPCAHSMVM